MGGHKFYLGRPVQGALYLLFFWTLLPLAVSIVELVLLAGMPDDRFSLEYD